MQRNITVRAFRLSLSVLTLGPALGDAHAAFIPENVGPAQRENLRSAQRRRRAGNRYETPIAITYFFLPAAPSLSRPSIRLRREFSSSSAGSPPRPPLVARIIPARSITTTCGMFRISFPLRPR